MALNRSQSKRRDQQGRPVMSTSVYLSGGNFAPHARDGIGRTAKGATLFRISTVRAEKQSLELVT
jgi:hypothetical protein